MKSREAERKREEPRARVLMPRNLSHARNVEPPVMFYCNFHLDFEQHPTGILILGTFHYRAAFRCSASEI